MPLNRNSTSATTRYPLPVNDVQHASGIISVVAEAHSAAAGAINTTGSFMLNFGPIASLLGDLVGRFLDTSLTFSGTALTTEVPFALIANRRNAANNTGDIMSTDEFPIDYTTYLLAGEYYVIYETARIYYKKADNTTAANATYKYRSASTSATTNAPVTAGTPGTITKIIASTAVPAAISAVALVVRSVDIQADVQNAGPLAIGDSNVNYSATIGVTRGTTLFATNTIHLTNVDLSQIFVDVSVNGDAVEAFYIL